MLKRNQQTSDKGWSMQGQIYVWKFWNMASDPAPQYENN